ncbi:MAG: RNA-binding S4 domain-containing protein [Proteobacteria bacterium]|nr:RNA-binding S4 domain-containing protein [Desulfobulbaceae bacterium]MBU4153856.1 RNA-binding S4 domain-containing protein [Pseudomonadota bacterium]MDP2105930.1 RNA-binding S4 domain-containing protein [Desulfobulbaceae bacterium]
MEKIAIRDGAIRLGQFLKLATVVSTGGEAKARIQAGEVKVNGAVELRRGAQLHSGDRVEIDGAIFQVG